MTWIEPLTTPPSPPVPESDGGAAITHYVVELKVGGLIAGLGKHPEVSQNSEAFSFLLVSIFTSWEKV